MSATIMEAGLVPASDSATVEASPELTLLDVEKLLEERGRRCGLRDEWTRPRPCRCTRSLPLADVLFGEIWARCVFCGHDVDEAVQP